MFNNAVVPEAVTNTFEYHPLKLGDLLTGLRVTTRAINRGDAVQALATMWQLVNAIEIDIALAERKIFSEEGESHALRQ